MGRGELHGCGVLAPVLTPCVSIWARRVRPGTGSLLAVSARPMWSVCRWNLSSMTCSICTCCLWSLGRIVFSGLKYSSLMRNIFTQEDSGSVARCPSNKPPSLSTAVRGGSCCPSKEAKRSGTGWQRLLQRWEWGSCEGLG